MRTDVRGLFYWCIERVIHLFSVLKVGGVVLVMEGSECIVHAVT